MELTTGVAEADGSSQRNCLHDLCGEFCQLLEKREREQYGEEDVFWFLGWRCGFFRRLGRELVASVGGLDVAAMKSAPLAEGIDRVVEAVSAEFFHLAGFEQFNFLRLVIVAENARLLRGSHGDFGLGKDMAAGGAGGFLADLGESIVLGFPQQQAHPSAGRAIGFR